MTAREAEIIELIRKEVKPALGCTEPIAVALAVAKAMEIAGQHCHPSDTDWRVNEGYSLLIRPAAASAAPAARWSGIMTTASARRSIPMWMASAFGARCPSRM